MNQDQFQEYLKLSHFRLISLNLRDGEWLCIWSMSEFSDHDDALIENLDDDSFHYEALREIKSNYIYTLEDMPSSAVKSVEIKVMEYYKTL
ncbi:hypothetical protein EC844_12534 [Acinetobacter calcoaceticus]|uniref:Uncharacterized protein n=1 Tax=Acinetobacter calcoaceticus TaxID=471 RepID=A0A4R1XGK2_ACICA|nr:hypothetical protein EC844_12534 [Acinetobacter calcoaceticus]